MAPLGDAHGFVIREVDLQPIGDLFGRSAIDPTTVTAVWLVSALERCLRRACDLAAISVMHPTFQAILHVLTQSRVSHQFRLLRPSGNQFRLPLSDRSPVHESTTTSCSVTGQLPLDH